MQINCERKSVELHVEACRAGKTPPKYINHMRKPKRCYHTACTKVAKAVLKLSTHFVLYHSPSPSIPLPRTKDFTVIGHYIGLGKGCFENNLVYCRILGNFLAVNFLQLHAFCSVSFPLLFSSLASLIYVYIQYMYKAPI